MILLVTDLTLTAYAQRHRDQLWQWIHHTEPWFYAGLDGIVQQTHWYDFGDTLQHDAEFTVPEALDRYRQLIARKRNDPTWERQRRNHTRWYQITNVRTAHIPRAPVGFPTPARSTHAALP